MLNGEFTVAGGDRRFRIISGGARGQGLRLRQMGDADGVFPGDSVSRSGGTERGGAAGSAGGGKKIGFRQCSIGGLESRQRAFQRTVGAKFSGKRRLLI